MSFDFFTDDTCRSCRKPIKLAVIEQHSTRRDLAIHKFAHLIAAGRPIPVFGDGSTRRDYTFIDDIVTGVKGALHYKASQFEVINLGNNNTVTLLEMIRGLEDAI